jgi:hypothetical protein
MRLKSILNRVEQPPEYLGALTECGVIAYDRFKTWPGARDSWSACGGRASGGGKTTFDVSTKPMALR